MRALSVRNGTSSDRPVQIAMPIAVPRAPELAQTISERTAYLLSEAHENLPEARSVLAGLIDALPNALRSAHIEEDQASLLDVHKALFAIYEVSFANPLSPVTA